MVKIGVCDSCQEKKELYTSFDKRFCKHCKRKLKKVQLDIMAKHPEIAGNPVKISEKMKERLLEAEQ